MHIEPKVPCRSLHKEPLHVGNRKWRCQMQRRGVHSSLLVVNAPVLLSSKWSPCAQRQGRWSQRKRVRICARLPTASYPFRRVLTLRKRSCFAAQNTHRFWSPGFDVCVCMKCISVSKTRCCSISREGTWAVSRRLREEPCGSTQLLGKRDP